MGLSKSVTAIALAAALATGCVQRPATTPIRIGHLAAFSGPERTRGDHARRGIQLAVSAAMAEDQKVAGRALVVHHADHAGDADVFQAEAVRLLAITQVSALIVSCDA